MYINEYESISDDVKYITNSMVRLKILATLYNHPQNIKDVSKITGISYSSVSNNMHDLENGGYVHRESNKYALSNSMRLQIKNILEVNELMGMIDRFFNIIEHHVVEIIPEDSVDEMYLLGKATLLESDDIDVYRTYNYIDDALREADYVKCVLPFYHESFNNRLNELVDNGKSVEAFVARNVHDVFKKKSKIEDISVFRRKNNFFLIVTGTVMILGLFRNDGSFDQNRLLVSRNGDSIKWADNLFENFKKKNK